MTSEQLLANLREVASVPPPLPGRGETDRRHRYLLELGRRDLSLARLAEAHWDAIAILAEAGREFKPGALYGVWAAEIPAQPLRSEQQGDCLLLTGKKMFASGAGLIDRALVTVLEPEAQLVDVDLRGNGDGLRFDTSCWATEAFRETNTGSAVFSSLRVPSSNVLGGTGWYLSRPGFWHGACGPASCWAGGAIGLLDYAQQQPRSDSHTLAHLGAMHATGWALRSYLSTAGREIDERPFDVAAARIRALTVRHLIERACSDILERILRAYGPYPLALAPEISKRYQELNLYIRQSHAERDLEALGREIHQDRQRPEETRFASQLSRLL